jgi:hypothetical protein
VPLRFHPLRWTHNTPRLAVDLFLGDEFHVWDVEKLKFEGFKPQLDLSQQEFVKTAMAFLIPLRKESDGSVIFPPFREHPWHILAVERLESEPTFEIQTAFQGQTLPSGEKK